MWMTRGIRTSVKCKWELYFNSRNSNDPRLKEYYKLNCKILSRVIKEARKWQYNKPILTSKNKTKTIWNNVKSKKGEKTMKKGISSLNINGTLKDTQQAIVHIFNNYFSIITEEITGTNGTDWISQLNKSYSSNNMFYPSIKFSHTSIH